MIDQTDVVVVRADDPRNVDLRAQGWHVAAESYGARLDAAHVDVDRLSDAVSVVTEVGDLRELGPDDVPAILALDTRTQDDYPGGPATAHTLLSPASALPRPGRRAFGLVVDADPGHVVGPDHDVPGGLVAMTIVDVAGDRAETDFTTVDADWRGTGIGTAVKAASVLALLLDDVTCFRTGGSSQNQAIQRSNARLGYVVDERWLTYRPTV